MKKYLAFLLVMAMFCALTAGGCGGGSDNDSSAPEQTENQNGDTDTNPDDEGRGNSGSTVDLSTLTGHYTAKDGETLTGTLDAILMVSVADGATVTLRDASINGRDDPKSGWAGLTCEGDATIILAGKNTIKGFTSLRAGIYIPQGKTLTIKGDGELTARGSDMGPGIGGGWDINCGNIVIDSGTINAYGGLECAGIGTGLYGSCGSITINGGNITAVKGNNSAFSVGPGYNYNGFDITICGLKYSATEQTFTYGLEPNTTGKFKVDINVAGAYNTKTIAFYGRKSLGLNEDGSYKLGGWERLQNWEGSWDSHTGDQSFEVLRKYVELGFEFDIASGTDWPYSDMFWSSSKTANEQVNYVYIDFGGARRRVSLKIQVNDRTLYSNDYCDSHSRRSW